MKNLSLKIDCIQSLTEFNNLVDNIDELRHLISYFNYSKLNDEKLKEEKTIAENGFSFFQIILYTIVVLISLAGNISILAVIYFDKSKRKSTNLFIFNLALCDMAILISCAFVQFMTSFNKYWMFGELFCKLNSFFQMVSILASVLTLLTIAVDRYIGILHPLKSKMYAQNKYYYLAIGLIWLTSISISIPTYIYRKYKEIHWLDFVEQICDDSGWPFHLKMNKDGCAIRVESQFKRIYYTFIITILFFIPFMIMIYLYSIMIHKLWRNREEVDQMVQSNNNRETLVKNQKKSILMLILILVTFFICWSPLELMILYIEYAEKVHKISKIFKFQIIIFNFKIFKVSNLVANSSMVFIFYGLHKHGHKSVHLCLSKRKLYQKLEIF